MAQIIRQGGGADTNSDILQQVVSAVNTAASTISADDTEIVSATITPTISDSTILILGHVSISGSSSGTSTGARIEVDSTTNVSNAPAAGSRTAVNVGLNGWTGSIDSLQVIGSHAPGDTSAHTYSIRADLGQSTSSNINSSSGGSYSTDADVAGAMRATSTIVLLEVNTDGEGIGKQVVQASQTGIVTLSTQSAWTDITGMSLNITPSSETSKILLLGQASIGTTSYSDVATCVRLMRDTTPICVGDTAGSRTPCTVGQGHCWQSSDINTIPFVFVDSPSTTSSTTYKVQYYKSYAGNLYLNRSSTDTDSSSFPRTLSNLIAIEFDPGA